MAKLSLYKKKSDFFKIRRKFKQKIQEVLLEEGIKTSIAAISLFLSRYRKTGRLIDARRSGRKPKLRQEHVDYMDEKMKENDEPTSRELKYVSMKIYSLRAMG
jgi:transposase